MKGKALLIVRATVDETARRDFDAWYEAEHLPDALKAFRCERAWRGWSRQDPAIHSAFYLFPNAAAAEAALAGDGAKGLIAEFDGKWRGRADRTREVFDLAGELVA